jgi:hypothetical protein
VSLDGLEQVWTIELAHVVLADGNAWGAREDAADEALEDQHLVHCLETGFHTGHVADYANDR